MFVVKQAVKCLSRQLQYTAASKISRSHGLSFGNCGVMRQSVLLADSQAHFSNSTNFASAPETIRPQTNGLVDQAIPTQIEPDVLYHMIEIETRSAEKAVLQSYNQVIALTAEHLGLTIGRCKDARKPHIKRWTVLKSRHVHNKHWVQYEVRTYHRKFQVLRITGSTADTFLEYIQRNLPEGVSMRVGRVRMEKLPDHLLSAPSPEDIEDK